MDGRSAIFANDENAVVTKQRDPSVSKTPATSKTRRAFGDISNRKKPATTGPAAKSVSFAKTANVNKPSVKVTTKTPFGDAKNRQDQTSAVERRVELKLPPTLKKDDGVVAPKDHSKPDDKSSELDSSFVDDIELPAGRLWIEQQALDDADDETVLSVEDGKTLRARYQALFDERHALKMQMEKEQRQRELDALDAKVQTFLDQEPGKFKTIALLCRDCYVPVSHDLFVLLN